jgi:hypothetical protein
MLLYTVLLLKISPRSLFQLLPLQHFGWGLWLHLWCPGRSSDFDPRARSRSAMEPRWSEQWSSGLEVH